MPNALSSRLQAVVDALPLEPERRVLEIGGAPGIAAGRMSTMCAAVEDFELDAGIPLFDLAFGCRVGALNGRHHIPTHRRS